MHKLIFEAYKAGEIDRAGELMKKHLEKNLKAQPCPEVRTWMKPLR